MKLGMYVMAPEPISATYFKIPLFVYHHIVARQRFSKTLPLQRTYARNNRRIIGRVISCAVRVISKESRWLILPSTCWFLFKSASCLKRRRPDWKTKKATTLAREKKTSVPFNWPVYIASKIGYSVNHKVLGLELRPLGRSARSQSLYRLRYPCSTL
jgi:hypothetical protein